MLSKPGNMEAPFYNGALFFCASAKIFSIFFASPILRQLLSRNKKGARHRTPHDGGKFPDLAIALL